MACNCTGRCLITGYCEAAQAIPGAVRIETAGFMRPVEKPVLKSEWDLMQDKVNQLSAENKKLKEENEKLKFENGEIGQLNEIIEAKDRELEHIYQLNYKLGDKVRALQTENAQLKAKIEQLSGISGQLKVLSVDDAVKLNQIICPRIKELESQLERANQFYKDLTAENVQLKVDNESLKDYAERRDQTIIALGKRSKAFDEEIAQLKAENKKLQDFVERNYTTFCYENMHSELMTLRNVSEYNCREVEKLSKENAQLKAQNEEVFAAYKKWEDMACECINENKQLKAQLQNCDKVSQVEHCEHSGVKLGVQKPICECCKGIGRLHGSFVTLGGCYAERDISCPRCCGTGVVWEPK
jgi:chromosome segregation ATPase